MARQTTDKVGKSGSTKKGDRLPGKQKRGPTASEGGAEGKKVRKELVKTKRETELESILFDSLANRLASTTDQPEPASTDAQTKTDESMMDKPDDQVCLHQCAQFLRSLH